LVISLARSNERTIPTIDVGLCGEQSRGNGGVKNRHAEVDFKARSAWVFLSEPAAIARLEISNIEEQTKDEEAITRFRIVMKKTSLALSRFCG